MEWKSLSLSIWCRIDVLQMNVLPRITFLIASTSSFPLPTERIFNEINGLFILSGRTRNPGSVTVNDRLIGSMVVWDFQMYTSTTLPLNSRYPLKWGYGDRASRMLAHQLKCCTAALIPDLI